MSAVLAAPNITPFTEIETKLAEVPHWGIPAPCRREVLANLHGTLYHETSLLVEQGAQNVLTFLNLSTEEAEREEQAAVEARRRDVDAWMQNMHAELNEELDSLLV